MKYLTLLLAAVPSLCAATDDKNDFSLGISHAAIEVQPRGGPAMSETLPASGLELRFTADKILVGVALYTSQEPKQAAPGTTVEMDKAAILKLGLRHPLNEVFAIYGWTGASYFSLEQETIAGVASTREHSPGIALFPFGVGVIANIGAHVRLDAGWSRYYDDSMEIGSGVPGDPELGGLHGTLSYVF